MIQKAHGPAPEASTFTTKTINGIPPGIAAATVKKISLTRKDSLGI
jgi:hypothetical protein